MRREVIWLPIEGRLEPTEARITELEHRFALELPADYRRFLAEHGGSYTQATVAFLEPTPIGTRAVVENVFGFFAGDRTYDLAAAAERASSAPTLVPIGEDAFGDLTYLFCGGRHRGCVVVADVQCRAAWDDDQFHWMYPNLSEEIEGWLRLRRAGALRPAIPGTKNLYLVARSFGDYLAALEPDADE